MIGYPIDPRASCRERVVSTELLQLDSYLCHPEHTLTHDCVCVNRALTTASQGRFMTVTRLQLPCSRKRVEMRVS